MPTGIGCENNKATCHNRLSPSRIPANLHICMSAQLHNPMPYRLLSNRVHPKKTKVLLAPKMKMSYDSVTATIQAQHGGIPPSVLERAFPSTLRLLRRTLV